MAPRISALIVVDMQEDFCGPNGSLAIPTGRALSTRLNHLLSLPFAIKATTQDWHPPDSLTFATTHSLAPFTSTYTGTNPSSPSESATWTVWPPHCVRDTFGASLIPELDTSNVDLPVLKGLSAETECYSGFGDVFGRKGPDVVSVDLAATLREKGVTDVWCGGLAAGHCVLETARGAVKEGFRAWVFWDCTEAVTQEGKEQARREMEEAGVRVVWSDGEEVREALEGKAWVG